MIRWRRRANRHGRGDLSVMVEVDDVNLAEFDEAIRALDELDRQTQLVVAAHTPAARAAALALDNPLVAVTSGGSAARREAAALARGRYVVALRTGQSIVPSTLSALTASLDESGSDLALEATQHGSAHDRPSPRTGVTLGEHPQLLRLANASVVVRTALWSAAADLTSAGPPDLDVTTAALLAATDRIDVVPVGSMRPPERSLEPIGVQPVGMRYAAAWVADVERVRASLPAAAEEEWVAYLLGDPLSVVLSDLEGTDDESWRTLHEAVARWTSAGGARCRPAGVEARVRSALVAAGRRRDVEVFNASRWYEHGQFRTELRDSAVYAALDVPCLSDDVLVLGPEETRLRVSLRDLRQGGDASVLATVWAIIRNIDYAGAQPSLEAWAVHSSGHTEAIETEQVEDVGVSEFAAQGFADNDAGAFHLRVPCARLARRPGKWWLKFRLTVAGIVREAELASAARTFGVPTALVVRVGETTVRLTSSVNGPLAVTVQPAGPSATGLELSDRVVTGRLAGAEPACRVEAVARGGATTSATTAADGTFELHLPDAPGGSWRLRVNRPGDGAVPLGWPAEVTSSLLPLGRDGVATTGINGGIVIRDLPDRLLVKAAHAVADVLHVEGCWHDDLGAAPTVELRGARATSSSTTLLRTTDGTWTARVPLSRAGEPLPADGYHLVVDGAPALVVPELVAAWPRTETPHHDVQLIRHGCVLRVRLQPSAPREPRSSWSSPWRQHRLRELQATRADPIDPGLVYLEAYDGESITDSPLAIQRELTRTRPDLHCVWGVADLSMPAPPGARTVLKGTPEWYDVVGRARYLVNNVDFDRTWRKRDGQRFLQTFHGYPSKSMGLSLWRTKRYSPLRIEAELDRTMRGWDLITVPTPEMAAIYRREYGYDGAIFDRGLPRNDALVAPSAAATRARVRRELGLAEDQVAVLYAPTWRDHEATSFREARFSTELDLGMLARTLGKDFVVLVRAHRFHTGLDQQPRHVRDVSTHPEINELILAADVGLFDYSSIRFDFALTGRPLLFFVPDLDRYAGSSRGFLFPFEGSAPGPLLRESSDVVDALRDLESVATTYAVQRKEFARRFNPFHDGHAAERLVAAGFFDPVDPHERIL